MDKTARHHVFTRRAVMAAAAALSFVFGISGSYSVRAQAPADPLPSWNDSQSKRSILEFVRRITRDGSSDYVQPSDRIAVFDNDGTLWCEHPMYVQLAFALDRIKAMAPMHPEWKDKQPFKAAIEGDMKTLAEAGERGISELIMVTHAGMMTTDFTRIVADWITTARHPRFKRLYTELVYQPMLEVMAFLRANGFKTYIVSGGGVEFMRPWSARVYGVPPEQVVGSSIKTKLEMRDGRPMLFRLSQLNFVDDGPGKPVGINEFIGRRPIAAFGNSDGDLQMLQWVTMSGGVRLGVIVHHTDAEREYAYDRDTSIGRLDRALTAAAANNWTVVDMKNDWKVIFPPEK